MSIKLEDCKEITGEEYMELKQPVFKAQTRVQEDNTYWMVFEDSGVLYKIHGKL